MGYAVLLACLALCLVGVARAVGGIDPASKYAWSTTTGWINFAPARIGCEGVTVHADQLDRSGET